MLGLALPPDHPVWTEPEKPIPVELGDTHRIIAAPGWMASGTRQDGIVRVLNIGTGGQDEGELVGEAPLYTSLGFSTATAPPQAGEWKLRSVANVVGLKNRQGWISARSGQKVERCEHIGEVLIGQSSWLAHWVLMASMKGSVMVLAAPSRSDQRLCALMFVIVVSKCAVYGWTENYLRGQFLWRDGRLTLAMARSPSLSRSPLGATLGVWWATRLLVYRSQRPLRPWKLRLRVRGLISH